MKYSEIIEELKKYPESQIDYTQYSRTVDGIKYPILELKDLEVKRYIEPMEFLKPEDVIEYYGEYNKGLVYSNNIRIVLKSPDAGTFDVDFVVLDINEISYENGLEEIRVKPINRSEDYKIQSWI